MSETICYVDTSPKDMWVLYQIQHVMMKLNIIDFNVNDPSYYVLK